MTTFLYTLNCPKTGEIRYVGKADNPFVRYYMHLREWRWAKNRKTNHRNTWIKSLHAEGLVPHMELLDEVPMSQWEFWEREYIRVFRAIGVNLTNGSDGGECGPRMCGPANPMFGRTLTHRTGVKLSPETIEKIRRANTGKRHSPEARKNISNGHLGQKAWNRGLKTGPWSPARRAVFEKQKTARAQVVENRST